MSGDKDIIEIHVVLKKPMRGDEAQAVARRMATLLRAAGDKDVLNVLIADVRGEEVRDA